MRLRVSCLTLILILGSTLHAEDWKPPELKVPVSKAAPPKIDGVLDDAIWKDAPPASDFKLKEDGKPDNKTRLLVTRDEKTLYIAIECFEPPEILKALKADTTQNDTDNIWTDDSVEIFIDPTNKRDTYYQLIVNSKGVVWDAYHTYPRNPDTSWNSDAKIAAKVGVESWVCELAIPFAAFNRTDATATEWAFNVARNRSVSEDTAYWSPVFSDSSHVPEKFGKLTAMPAISLKPAAPAIPAEALKPAEPAKPEEKK